MLEKLESLLLLAQEKHFGRAAEAAGVSQPAFSLAIRTLEEHFGTPLVIRTGRFCGFTPEGERVLEWARRIVGDTRAMRDEVRNLRGRVTGTLRIGAIPTTLPYVPNLTIPFHERHRDVQISISSMTSTEIMSALDNLELDIGISYIDNEPIGRMVAVPLYQEHYSLLVDAASTMARRSEITWAEAAKLPLCLLTPDTQTRRILDSVLAGVGGLRAPTLQSNSMMTLFAHVRRGHWVGIIPARLMETMENPRQLMSVPLIEPRITKSIGLLLRGKAPQRSSVAAFVELATLSARQPDNRTVPVD